MNYMCITNGVISFNLKILSKDISTYLDNARQLRGAITDMDEVLVDREGIDKLQQLLPTQEELKLISEHQGLNKELPLGKFVSQC